MPAAQALFRILAAQIEEVRATELQVGTRSTCSVTLDDPIAAERHCSLSFESGSFVLRGLPTATGTFLNGLLVSGPAELSDGDRIVVGVTLLEVHLPGEDQPVLELKVSERTFFYTAKKREQFTSDADEWVRSEVRFGRSRALGLAVVFALAASVFLMGGMWFRPWGERMLQPGSLSMAHAQLFESSPPAFLDARAVQVAREQGCQACHDDYDRTPVAKCASCHAEVVESARERKAHPFGVGDELDCTRCHTEHHGEAPLPGVLYPASANALCIDCHADDDATDIGNRIAAAVEEYGLDSDVKYAARSIPRGYDGFHHSSHGAIACRTCHVESDGALLDFEVVMHGTCLGCHGEQRRDSGHTVGVEYTVALRWHGSGAGGENCTSCHIAAFDPRLKTVSTLPSPALLHSIRFRSHSDEMLEQADAADCRECHIRGVNTLAGLQGVDRPFAHALHMPALDAYGDPQAARALSEECSRCHTEITARVGLTQVPEAYAGPEPEACGRCHFDDSGVLITARGQGAATGSPAPTPQFSHSEHGLDVVREGCFACHSFGPDAAGDPMLVGPTTKPEAQGCVACHLTEDRRAHFALGSNGCELCHPSGAESMNPVFYFQQEPTRRPRWFPHDGEAHSEIDCTTCHGAIDSPDSDVRMPSRSDPVCRSCHAARDFHWR